MKVKNVDHELEVTVELSDGRVFKRVYKSITGKARWYQVLKPGHTQTCDDVQSRALEIEYLKKHAATLRA